MDRDDVGMIVDIMVVVYDIGLDFVKCQQLPGAGLWLAKSLRTRPTVHKLPTQSSSTGLRPEGVTK